MANNPVSGNPTASITVPNTWLDFVQQSEYKDSDVAAKAVTGLGYTPMNPASYTAADVAAKAVTGLGYTPMNPASYTAADVAAKAVTGLGYTPMNPASYTADDVASKVVTGLGYTPMNPASYTAADVAAKAVTGLGYTPLSGQPAFTIASALANLVSGESQSTSLGKIAKAISNLIAHLANTQNPHNVTKAQVGLGNCNNTADSEKSVNYATSAGSATSAGNANTVDNYHAGTTAGCLIPVTAFNFGASSGYIKLGNGLILQWRQLSSCTEVTWPIAFSNTNYFCIGCIIASNNDPAYLAQFAPKTRNLTSVVFPSTTSATRLVFGLGI